MKKITKLFGIIALITAIGFSMAACDDGSNDDNGGGNSSLNGTWVNSAEGSKIVLNNGNITVSRYNFEETRGTYSTSRSNFTMSFTQITGAMLGPEEVAEMGLSTSQWYTQSQLRTAIIQAMVSAGMTQEEATARYDDIFGERINEMFASQAGKYTLSGNTLTITMKGETTVFTRQ